MTPIRRLYETEIECRVAQCGKNKGKDGAWCSILLYKDARVDQRILDEVFGPMNWQREHVLIGDRLYCTVSIWDAEKGQWIKKQDVGTESYTEKEKGQASDSFKRACFNVGIGRELYTAPKIFINLNEGEYKASGDKVYPSISLDVKEILYDDKGNISKLILVDSKGNERYTYGAKQTPAPQKQEDNRPWMNEKQLNSALERINAGLLETADKCKETMRMKKEYKERIENAVHEYKVANGMI